MNSTEKSAIKTIYNISPDIEQNIKEVFKNAGRLPTLEQALDLAFFVKYIVHINPENLQYASKRLQNNKEIVLNAISQDGNTLRFASEALRNNKQIVLTAIKTHDESKQTCPQAMQYASNKLKNDKQFITEALRRSNEVSNYISANFEHAIENERTLNPIMKITTVMDRIKIIVQEANKNKASKLKK